MVKRREKFVYGDSDDDIVVEYEPVSSFTQPVVTLSGGGYNTKYTITTYGRESIERLADVMTAIRADLAVRKGKDKPVI